jgi:hypothetical protein
MPRYAITSAEMRAAFPVGSKVGYSQLGLDVCNPRDPKRIGEVWGYGMGGCPQTVCAVRVHWPGRKTSEVLHKNFLKLATRSEPPAGAA